MDGGGLASPRLQPPSSQWLRVLLLAAWGIALLTGAQTYNELVARDGLSIVAQLEAGSVRLAVANNLLARRYMDGSAEASSRLALFAGSLREGLIMSSPADPLECLAHADEVSFLPSEAQLNAHQMCGLPLPGHNFITSDSTRRLLQHNDRGLEGLPRRPSTVGPVDSYRTYLLKLFNSLGPHSPRVHLETVVDLIHEVTETELREERNQEAEGDESHASILTSDAASQHSRLMELRREYARTRKQKKQSKWAEDSDPEKADRQPIDISAVPHPVSKGVIRAYYELYHYQQVLRRVAEVRQLLEPYIKRTMARNDTMLYNYI